MSLVRTLLSGGSMESTIDPDKYTHDTGAMRIAMESVEELHEIFIESFYNVEQAELAATTEGVELVGSDYEVVAEASKKKAFSKIKEFIQKLWDKVKAWLRNVERFISSLFMSGKEFVKKYEKDIKDAKLKDFSYKMYTYTGINVFKAKEDVFDMDAKMESYYNKIKKNDSGKNRNTDEIKAYIEPEEVFKRNSQNKATTSEEFAAWAFGYFRNGAKDENSKKEESVTSLQPYADVLLKSSSVSDMKLLMKKTDAAYKKAIDLANAEERASTKEANSLPDSDDTKVEKQTDAEKMRLISQGLSREQSVTNTMMNAWKTALTERDNVYKQLIMAGLANSRKASKQMSNNNKNN